MKRYLFSKAALLNVVIVPLSIVAIMLFISIKGINDTAFALTKADCRACHCDKNPQGQCKIDPKTGNPTTVNTHHMLNNTPIKCPSASPYVVCPTTANYSCQSCHALVWDPKISAYTTEVIKDCIRCHSSADHTTVHDNKVVLDSTACSQCHAANVVTEHNKYNQGCSVCHDSTNQTIIAALNKAKTSPPIYCSDCHGATDHAAAHDHAKIDSVTCQQCHQANVVTEHVTNRGLTCGTCHNSADQKVITAINKGKGPNGLDVFCYDCHGTTDHAQAHNKAIIPYADCGYCHSANVVTEHVTNRALTCATCHSSTNTSVQAAITKGKGLTGQTVYCADCHNYINGFGNHTKQHDQTNPNVVTSHEQLTPPVYCVACHISASTTVIAAINKGMSGQPVQCADCHIPQNQPPVANAGPDKTVTAGTTVSFSGSSSYDPDGTITSYAWNFGDGSTGNGVTTSHTYTTAGTFTVTLTVTDNNGATGTDTAIVTVTSLANTNLALKKSTSASGSESGYGSSNAVDGNMTTRWWKKSTSEQWIRVDLGSSMSISKVILKWHSYYAKDYYIETSTDGSYWSNVKSVSGSDGGTDENTFSSKTARYVRVRCKAAYNYNGYSLYEFEVYK